MPVFLTFGPLIWYQNSKHEFVIGAIWLDVKIALSPCEPREWSNTMNLPEIKSMQAKRLNILISLDNDLFYLEFLELRDSFQFCEQYIGTYVTSFRNLQLNCEPANYLISALWKHMVFINW